jgi:hypothetical protein
MGKFNPPMNSSGPAQAGPVFLTTDDVEAAEAAHEAAGAIRQK